MLGKPMEDSPSPLGRWLDGTLEKLEHGRLQARYRVRAEMTNPYGTLHGGAISAIMDDLIGATIHTMDLGANYSTVSMHVDFLSWASAENDVVVRTEVLRQGRRIVHATAELEQEGRVVARGSASLLRVGVPLNAHDG